MSELSPTDIAKLRGEALAGQLMGAAVIRLALSGSSEPNRVMSLIMSYIDQTLNSSGSLEGDEEVDPIMRETARQVIDQHLAAIPRRRK